MTPTLALALALAVSRLPRTTLRFLVACCAHDCCPDLAQSRIEEPYASLWTRLWHDRDWAPSADDGPLPLREVEAWLRHTDAEGQETQGKLRGWLETRLREEDR